MGGRRETASRARATAATNGSMSKKSIEPSRFTSATTQPVIQDVNASRSVTAVTKGQCREVHDAIGFMSPGRIRPSPPHGFGAGGSASGGLRAQVRSFSTAQARARRRSEWFFVPSPSKSPVAVSAGARQRRRRRRISEALHVCAGCTVAR